MSQQARLEAIKLAVAAKPEISADQQINAAAQYEQFIIHGKPPKRGPKKDRST